MQLTKDFLNQKNNKLGKIRDILRCPICGHDQLIESNKFLQCNSCQEEFKCNENSYNFLPQSLIEYGNIQSTENVSSHDYDSIALNYIEEFQDGLILDNGCGLRNVYYDNVVNFEIVDYPTTDVLGIGEKLPFKSNTFDAVFSLNVLEHVKNPFECANEIIRVLKPGGILYVVVPFLQPFHGYPNHYYNMTSSGLKNLFSGRIQIIESTVPLAGLPIWSLHLFLNYYIQGLPKPVASKFKNMKIYEFLDNPIGYFEKDFVSQLKPGTNEELACTNSLVAKKIDLQSNRYYIEAGKEQNDSQLHWTELEELQIKFQYTQAELQRMKSEIETMQQSKFWKLRAVWLNFKNLMVKK
jgi:SAM-dependent methyltransferase